MVIRVAAAAHGAIASTRPSEHGQATKPLMSNSGSAASLNLEVLSMERLVVAVASAAAAVCCIILSF